MMSTIHSLLIQAEYFNLIDKGQKRVEGRLCSHKYTLVKEGDTFEFVCLEDTSQKIYCTVMKIFKYASFKLMLEEQGLDMCLPGVTSLEEGVKRYQSFPGYLEGEPTMGAIAFLIQKIQGGLL